MNPLSWIFVCIAVLAIFAFVVETIVIFHKKPEKDANAVIIVKTVYRKGKRKKVFKLSESATERFLADESFRASERFATNNFAKRIFPVIDFDSMDKNTELTGNDHPL